MWIILRNLNHLKKTLIITQQLNFKKIMYGIKSSFSNVMKKLVLYKIKY